MKNIILISIIGLLAPILSAQNPIAQKTQLEAGAGFVLPFYQSGKELLRSADLRQNGQSHFADAAGIRKNVGTYPRNSGYSIHIGYHKPVKWAKGLLLGAVIRNAQTGSQPAEGGYTEGYFFNFITAGATVKYYPFKKTTCLPRPISAWRPS